MQKHRELNPPMRLRGFAAHQAPVDPFAQSWISCQAANQVAGVFELREPAEDLDERPPVARWLGSREMAGV